MKDFLEYSDKELIDFDRILFAAYSSKDLSLTKNSFQSKTGKSWEDSIDVISSLQEKYYFDPYISSREPTWLRLSAKGKVVCDQGGIYEYVQRVRHQKEILSQAKNNSRISVISAAIALFSALVALVAMLKSINLF